MSEFNFQEGELILIDKPLTWTSFDVVNKIRWNIKQKLGVKKIKVGHAGTLDPLATGLLIICTGKNTKIIESIQAEEKTAILLSPQQMLKNVFLLQLLHIKKTQGGINYETRDPDSREVSHGYHTLPKEV
ncbi:MAG: hypothetical protein V4622_01630, partial [Bacteroidota bacterium]